MNRRLFVRGSALALTAAPLAGCGASTTPSVSASRVGPIFLAHVNAIPNFPDAQTLSLIKATASSHPSPQQVEVALALLGNYTSGTQIPGPIPPAAPLSFPADHGEHFDTTIEWRYITLSLSLSNGGRVSFIGNFFRKSIADAVNVPDATPLQRQVYSTSMAVTIEMPGQPGAHYAWPTTTFAPIDGTVSVSNNPFRMILGKNSLIGTSDVFPLSVHVEDGGDPSVGRPPVAIDVTCAASNPLFLQGLNGYVGAETKPGEAGAHWYYYSWPQQQTTGTVTIAGTTYGVTSGLAWLDHQFGGTAAITSGSPYGPQTGWCWFEFQFDGDRSLTCAFPHGPITGGVLPPAMSGFGTYAENGKSTLCLGVLNVSSYVPSPNTDARYPSGWNIAMAGTAGAGPSVDILVKPVVTVEPQTLLMGTLQEYSEANCTVTALGKVNGADLALSGVGYCEGVGFETPAAYRARATAFLQSNLRT